jgi:cell division protein FtsB
MSNYIQPTEIKALQSNQHSNIEIHSLKNENDKLKKEIMIMEGEIKKYKNR